MDRRPSGALGGSALSLTVEILAVDWDRLRRAYPGTDERVLIEAAVDRGRRILGVPPEARVPSTASTPRPLRWLRGWFPRKAASVAVHRLDFAMGRERYVRATAQERETYERHLELEKDEVPPLKEEAKSLRAEIRWLEDELRALGIDPDGIGPRIEWRTTLSVDGYVRPRYETAEDRRRTAVELFRRVGDEPGDA